jgi:hypothetical protein
LSYSIIAIIVIMQVITIIEIIVIMKVITIIQIIDLIAFIQIGWDQLVRGLYTSLTTQIRFCT